MDGSVTTHRAIEGSKWIDWLGSSLDDLTPSDWNLEAETSDVIWYSTQGNSLYQYELKDSDEYNVDRDNRIISNKAYKIKEVFET